MTPPPISMPSIAALPGRVIRKLRRVVSRADIIARTRTAARIETVATASPESWFQVRLNGVDLWLPRFTVMTMRGSIVESDLGRIDLLVERGHWQRIFDQITEGTLFLDIGAATGAMSAPYAKLAAGRARFAAFEPARTARSMLAATLERNRVAGVSVIPIALSEAVGSFEFIEYPEDPTGVTTFLPEASRLATPDETADFKPVYAGQQKYTFEVQTLDSFIETLDFAGARKIVAKVDVEGFEHKVLAGARATLARFRPFLSIDIHVHPGETRLTDTACAALLEPLGYRLERIGHVMLAHPG